ncbi:MAG: tetratricopeptide repeat protein, partial [Bacteroidota bacterium]
MLIQRLFVVFVFSGLLSFTTLVAQTSKRDSLKSLINSYQKQDSLRLQLLLQLAEEEKGAMDASYKSLLNEGLTLSQDLRSPSSEGKFRRLLMRYYVFNQAIENAIDEGLKASRIFDSLDIQSEKLLTNADLIPIYSSYGYLEKALNLSLKSLELVENEPESPSKARYYFGAANAYKALKKYDSALSYYGTALRISENFDFKPGTMVINSNIGQI